MGQQELQRRPVSVSDCVAAAEALLETEIRQAKARIVVPATLPVVLADATLLQVVFQNLLGNAVKFVAPGVRPEVQITAETRDGLAIVSVADNGLGFPEDSRGQVFRMFERFHPDQPGSGIGLAIVHRAIERMGGRIGLEPAPTGTGTRFWIELPLA